MTQEHLPVGPSGDIAACRPITTLAACSRSRTRGRLTALALELQDERRDEDEIDLLAYWHILAEAPLAGIEHPGGRGRAGCCEDADGDAHLPRHHCIAVGKGHPGRAGRGYPARDSDPYGWDPDFLQTQYELIQSKSLAERVANELNSTRRRSTSLSEPGLVGTHASPCCVRSRRPRPTRRRSCDRGGRGRARQASPAVD